MIHENRLRAGSFGDDAEQYDRARPSYAPALVDDLLADGARRVVDVGCGTGIVSRLFVARGCDVVGVEPDERMAAVARRHGLRVESATFETWDAGGEPFDLLVSGQAWHWVDPAAGPAKAAAVLRPGGRFGVFWNVYAHEPAVAAAMRAVYKSVAPGLLEDSIVLGTFRSAPVAEADAAWLAPYGFGDVAHRSYPWEHVYSRDEWLDQLPTHSDHRLQQPDVLDTVIAGIGAVIDDFGGSITVQHATRLLTAVRAS
jgi:SAM-dependent methyltransferase